MHSYTGSEGEITVRRCIIMTEREERNRSMELTHLFSFSPNGHVVIYDSLLCISPYSFFKWTLLWKKEEVIDKVDLSVYSIQINIRIF